MSDIEVVTAALNEAAAQLGLAAEAAASVSPDATVGLVAGALPSSSSASAARTCETAWRTRLSEWVTAAEAQRTRLTDSAAAYDGSDVAAYSQRNRLQQLRHRAA